MQSVYHNCILTVVCFISFGAEANNDLPFPVNVVTTCLETSSSNVLQLNCSDSDQIAIESVQYGYKTNSLQRCATNASSVNSDECCSKNTMDCSVQYINGSRRFSKCIGQTNCTVSVTNDEQDTSDCTSQYDVRGYIAATYYCLSADLPTINLADTAAQLTAEQVFLQSMLYPESDVQVSVTCSVETDCGSTIETIVIDSDCQQSNNSGLGDDIVGCDDIRNDEALFIRTVERNDSSNFLIFAIFNSTGRLWIMFKSSVPSSNVTVKCGTEADFNSTTNCSSSTLPSTAATSTTIIASSTVTSSTASSSSSSSSTSSFLSASSSTSINTVTTLTTFAVTPTDLPVYIDNGLYTGYITSGVLAGVLIVGAVIVLITIKYKKHKQISNKVKNNQIGVKEADV